MGQAPSFYGKTPVYYEKYNYMSYHFDILNVVYNVA